MDKQALIDNNYHCPDKSCAWYPEEHCAFWEDGKCTVVSPLLRLVMPVLEEQKLKRNGGKEDEETTNNL